MNDSILYNIIRDTRLDVSYITSSILYNLYDIYNNDNSILRNVISTYSNNYQSLREVQKTYKSNTGAWYDNTYHTIRTVCEIESFYNEILRINRFYDEYYTNTLRDVTNCTNLTIKSIINMTRHSILKSSIYKTIYNDDILIKRSIRLFTYTL